MSNLKIGDIVMHLGQKRVIARVSRSCDTLLYKLSGYGPMVLRRNIKPVLTVRDGVIIAGPRG